MESSTLFVHIAAGSLAILAGGVAVYAAKGADLHRSSGRVFVYAMIVMGVTGLIVAVARNIMGSVLGGPLAAYLVITALTTVRPFGRRFDLWMIGLALAISATAFGLVANAAANGRNTIDGVPLPMILFFAIVALLAGLADMRVLKAGGIQGSRRIARHLWRMCLAFWIATGSFFLGQMDEFPAWLQNGALMAIPAFFPIAVMIYWLWRVRIRRMMAGLTVRTRAGVPAIE